MNIFVSGNSRLQRTAQIYLDLQLLPVHHFNTLHHHMLGYFMLPYKKLLHNYSEVAMLCIDISVRSTFCSGYFNGTTTGMNK